FAPNTMVGARQVPIRRVRVALLAGFHGDGTAPVPGRIAWVDAPVAIHAAWMANHRQHLLEELKRCRRRLLPSKSHREHPDEHDCGKRDHRPGTPATTQEGAH